MIQKTASKKITELTRSLQSRPRSVNLKQLGIMCSLAIVIIIILWGFSQFLPIVIVSPTASLSTSTESLIPPILPTRIVDEKEIPMILVPAGNFEMGSNSHNSDESPAHTVYLDDYYIDQYEVTNGQYEDCVQARRCERPIKESSWTHLSGYYSTLIFDKYPVIYVNWNMAKAYCEWRDARLPREAEWEKAARGDKDERTYPWGEGIECFHANYINCIYVDTQETTKFSQGKSPYGIYNMAGNVWEWVADWYLASYYQDSEKNNPTGPSSGTSRVMRGGAFYEQFTELRVTNREPRSPSIADYDIGFRCARSPSENFP